jgi:hypothetical protein
MNGSSVKPVVPDVNAANVSGGTFSSGQLAFWSDSTGTLGGVHGGYDTFKGSVDLGYSSVLPLGTDAIIAGGAFNSANGDYSTVGGGESNSADQPYATVAGGFRNFADASGATVGGGISGQALSLGSTVAGGVMNRASGAYSTVAGGRLNWANQDYATVGGGYENYAGGFLEGSYATVAGGQFNWATGPNSTVGGGWQNSTSGGSATVGGGESNEAGGFRATVPGGFSNFANAEQSFAAGSRATALSGHHGTIIFSDDSQINIPFNSAAADEFAVRATGGFRLVTAIDTSGSVTKMVGASSSGFLGVSTNIGSGAFTPQYAFDLRTPGSSSAQMHITPGDVDSGGYLTSANPGNLFMSAGAVWNGSAWVAKNSTAYQYGGGTAGVRFFFDTGLTVGSTYTPTTRMFIGPTGHVGIGMSTAPAHLLQLGLDDAAKPSTNTWTIASDGRLKDPESIEPFTEGSELIRRLPQPVWFRYRKESGLPSDRRVAGWVAQDIAPVAPFMVRRTRQKLSVNDREDTETLSLNTNELSYAVVNTLKELLEDNRHLHERIHELGGLSMKVEQLERILKVKRSS